MRHQSENLQTREVPRGDIITIACLRILTLPENRLTLFNCMV